MVSMAYRAALIFMYGCQAKWPYAAYLCKTSVNSDMVNLNVVPVTVYFR